MGKVLRLVPSFSLVFLSGCMFFGSVPVGVYEYGEQKIKFSDGDTFSLRFKEWAWWTFGSPENEPGVEFIKGNPYSIEYRYSSDNLRKFQITAAYLYDEDETTNYTIMFTNSGMPRGRYDHQLSLAYKPVYYLKANLLIERFDGEQILKEVTLRFELKYTIKRYSHFYFYIASR